MSPCGNWLKNSTVIENEGNKRNYLQLDCLPRACAKNCSGDGTPGMLELRLLRRRCNTDRFERK